MSKSKSLISFFLTLIIPLFYFFNLALIWKFQGTTAFPPTITVAGVISALIGVLLWGASFWELKSVFQVLPTTNRRIKKGVYRWLKHPMYTGILLVFAGLGLAFQSKPGLIFTSLVVFPVLVMRALLEEKKLTD